MKNKFLFCALFCLFLFFACQCNAYCEETIKAEVIPLNSEETTFPQAQIEVPAKEQISENEIVADSSEKPVFLQENAEEQRSQTGFAKFKDSLKGNTCKTNVQEWLDGDYATGKWFGARPFFEDHGLKIDSSWLFSNFTKTQGGATEERNNGGYSLFNIGVTFDTEKANL